MRWRAADRYGDARPPGPAAGVESGYPSRRAARYLRQSLGGEHIRLGAQCTGFTQDTDGVIVRFADGQQVRGDLLIGADGLSSVVRAELFGAASPDYAGYSA